MQPCACCLSPLVHMIFEHVDLEDLLFLVSIPSGSYSLSASSSWGLLSPERRDLIEICHFGQSVIRSLTMSGYVSLCLFPFAAGRSLSDND